MNVVPHESCVDVLSYELKADLRYWKAFLVWSDDWDKLRKISTFLNSGNKIKAFEASWAANIVVARDVWVHIGARQKRENAKTQSPQWKVSYEQTFVKVIAFQSSIFLVVSIS